MEILRNSVWDVKNFEGLEAGLYRILLIDVEYDQSILFPILESNEDGRPSLTNFSDFEGALSEHDILRGSFKLPTYMLLDDDEISQKHLKLRDENYKLIHDLISDEGFLFEISTSKRVRTINTHASKLGANPKKVLRMLKLYWKYGQTPNALIPAYKKCGGYGKSKTITNKPLGAPKKARTLIVERTKNFIVTEEDKDKFRKTLSTHLLKAHGKSLRQTYRELLRTYYADEIRTANALDRVPNVPSLAQLRYWKNKLFDRGKTVKLTTTERDYRLNRRGATGSTSTKWSVPGDCFEIDATVADVHIVSEWSQNLILGRPTIYSVVDRATSSVCGLNVSLFHASWRAARQALANTFLPKAEYCKEFGIDIQDDDWPMHHIPLALMCDNGEMIGLQPQKIVVPLTELQLSPPYTPYFKSLVENRFGLLNKEVIHNLLGTTRGGKVVRGDKDPRKDAVYTLKEFTALLIDAALELNRTQYERLARSNPLLIKYDLPPTPLNYWKINVLKHKHSLQAANSDQVISLLYPPAKVVMTWKGIEYNGMYYSCERIEQDNLTSVARTHGSWELDARINENTTNYIFVKLYRDDDFVKCNLLDRSNMFANKPMYEAEAFDDWRDETDAKAPVSTESIESQKVRKEIEKAAKARKTAEEPIPFSRRVENMRQSRQDEIESTTNAIGDKKGKTQPSAASEPEPESKSEWKPKKVKLPRRPKGK